MVKISPAIAVGVGSVPSQGAEIPHASWPRKQDIKTETTLQQIRPYKWSASKKML